MSIYRTRITTKGQVVIPKHLRDKARLRIGDSVQIVNQDRSVRVVRRSGWALATAGCLPSAHPPIDPEALEELIERTALQEARDEWGDVK